MSAFKYLEQRFFVSVPHTRHSPVTCEAIAWSRKLLSWRTNRPSSRTDEDGELAKNGVGSGAAVSRASTALVARSPGASKPNLARRVSDSRKTRWFSLFDWN